MRFTKLLLGSLCQAENSDYDPVFNPNEVGAAPTFQQSFLNQHADMSFDEFEKLYPQLRVDNNWYGMGHGLEEDFRVFKRDCHNFGHCRYTQKFGFSRSHWHAWLARYEPDDGARTVNLLTNRGSVRTQWPVRPGTIRENRRHAEWRTNNCPRSGCRSCRRWINHWEWRKVDLRGFWRRINRHVDSWVSPKSLAVNYGSVPQLPPGKGGHCAHGNLGSPMETSPGNKYMGDNWRSSQMHGKNKHPWTQLNDHIFRDNVTAEQLVFYQNKGVNVDGPLSAIDSFSTF